MVVWADGRVGGSPPASIGNGGEGAIIDAGKGYLGEMAQLLGLSPLALVDQLNRGTVDLTHVSPASAQQLKEAAAGFAAKIDQSQVESPFIVFEEQGRRDSAMVIPRERLGELADVAVRAASEAAGKQKVKTAEDFEFTRNTTLDQLMGSGPASRGGALADEQWHALQALKERFDISFEGGVLAINPKKMDVAALSFGTLGGPVVDETAEGGRSLAPPAGASFGRAEIISVTPNAFALNRTQDPSLAQQHLDLDREQSAMLIELKNGRESEKFVLLFGKEGNGWMSSGNDAIATLCQAVTIYPFDGGGPQIVAFKPVIYLYPAERTRVQVSVDVGSGSFIAQYPKMVGGAWEMIAAPNGALLDPKTDRQYPYLFWEARLSRPFFLEKDRCFCIARGDATQFLEEVSDRFALNPQECADFVSYWLPSFLANPYTIVQFMEEQYQSQARLDVFPAPDTVIRLYLVIAGSSERVETGLSRASDLIQRERIGFTVVEWGGSNLDLHRPV